MTNSNINPQDIPLEISLIVTQKNDKPCIELRKVTTDIKLIKIIVSCAFHNKPIVFVPKFTNQLHSLSSLVEKGILYQKDGKYFWVD